MEKNLSRRECMKMIKFTIKSKSKEEESKKEDEKKSNNKKDLNSKIKEVIKSLLLLQIIMMTKFGKKSSQNTNLNLDL